MSLATELSPPLAARGSWASPGRLLMLVFVWLAATAAWRPLMLPDEGRYVGVAWEMLQRGEFVTPTLDGLPYFHKPPLMYWITAAAMKLAGPTGWAMRAAPLLGAMAMVLALWCAVAGASPAGSARRREAALAVALLVTTPFVFLGAQYADCDMLVAGAVSLAVACARRAFERHETAARRWIVAAWVAAAFAVLAKGLIGVVLPALVLLPWLAATRRWRGILALLDPLALALFLLIAAPWFVLAQQAHPGFVDYFVVEQHFRRFTQTSFNNREPFWFYFAVLPLAMLPAALWLPAAAGRLRRAWRRAGAHADTVFAAWWIAAVLLFFSAPASKLVGYVLPAAAPMAWLLARALRGRRPAIVVATLVAGAATCLLAWTAVFVKGPAGDADLAAALAAARAPGERVVFLGDPFFDLRLLARLESPPAVIGDWSSAERDRRDDWRRELRDAGRFDPAAAAEVLWSPQELVRRRCDGRSWLVISGATPPPAGFEDAVLVAQGRRGRLWRADAPAACR
ncbi:ArnT family glycosyltransferase [Rubrivivax gelatinosus]|nr:glycosyltransferase family 39 protein [Rubrivivax gelatinosus]